ncbi:MAG: ABC transporter ATP-binding protein [Candidatus Bathyarchaeota archaeon]|nr:ABC transporter ATP-binding protein [Candidatus Bathyarchaeota archaeon]
MSGIEVYKLTKRFKSTLAVEDLSFEVGSGEIFGLLGPNGSGKTTTIRMLSCLISPTGGSARVNGYDIVSDAVKVRGSVGVLTESPSLYERLTAIENMNFFSEAYGLKGVSKDSRIREVLEFFELWDRRNERVGTYSKGMKQKLAIARSIVHNPAVVFLDEPTSGLDPKAAKDIRELMERLSRQEKRTILLCTHNMEDAEKLCDRVMILRKGKSVAMGSLEVLRRLLKETPILEVKLVEISAGVVESLKGFEIVRKFTEHDRTLSLELDDPDGSIPETVKRIVDAGGRILSVSLHRSSLEDTYLELLKEREK